MLQSIFGNTKTTEKNIKIDDNVKNDTSFISNDENNIKGQNKTAHFEILQPQNITESNSNIVISSFISTIESNAKNDLITHMKNYEARINDSIKKHADVLNARADIFEQNLQNQITTLNSNPFLEAEAKTPYKLGLQKSIQSKYTIDDNLAEYFKNIITHVLGDSIIFGINEIPENVLSQDEKDEFEKEYNNHSKTSKINSFDDYIKALKGDVANVEGLEDFESIIANIDVFFNKLLEFKFPGTVSHTVMEIIENSFIYGLSMALNKAFPNNTQESIHKAITKESCTIDETYYKDVKSCGDAYNAFAKVFLESNLPKLSDPILADILADSVNLAGAEAYTAMTGHPPMIQNIIDVHSDYIN